MENEMKAIPISVLLPAYNGMPYLVEAVDSILAQTFRDFELVIVNDGSTDDTAAYLDGLTDPRVRVLHQPNRGLSFALNAGLELCQGEFTARMDADDVAHEERLAEQVRYLLAHPEVGLLGTQIRPLGPARAGRTTHLPLTMPLIEKALLDCRHALCHPSVMFRTELVKELGGYWPEQLGEEWDLFLRVGERSELANLNRALLLYRVHGGSINGKRQKELRQHLAYAVDCALSRRQARPRLSYHEFLAQHATRPAFTRFTETLDLFALRQYRRAQTEILGHRPWQGYVRLAAAAACSPKSTTHRIARTVRSLVGKFSRH